MPLLEPDSFEMCGVFLQKLEDNQDEFEEVYTGKCRCKTFQVSLDNIGPTSESEDHPLSYCKNYIALSPTKSWAPIRTWFEALMFWENQRKED